MAKKKKKAKPKGWGGKGAAPREEARDELLALQAIYGEDLKHLPGGDWWSLPVVPHPGDAGANRCSVVLNFCMPPGYPNRALELRVRESRGMDPSEARALGQELRARTREAVGRGEICVFDLVQAAQDALQEMNVGDASRGGDSGGTGGDWDTEGSGEEEEDGDDDEDGGEGSDTLDDSEDEVFGYAAGYLQGRPSAALVSAEAAEEARGAGRTPPRGLAASPTRGVAERPSLPGNAGSPAATGPAGGSPGVRSSAHAAAASLAGSTPASPDPPPIPFVGFSDGGLFADHPGAETGHIWESVQPPSLASAASSAGWRRVEGERARPATGTDRRKAAGRVAVRAGEADRAAGARGGAGGGGAVGGTPERAPTPDRERTGAESSPPPPARARPAAAGGAPTSPGEPEPAHEEPAGSEGAGGDPPGDEGAPPAAPLSAGADRAAPLATGPGPGAPPPPEGGEVPLAPAVPAATASSSPSRRRREAQLSPRERQREARASRREAPYGALEPAAAGARDSSAETDEQELSRSNSRVLSAVRSGISALGRAMFPAALLRALYPDSPAAIPGEGEGEGGLAGEAPGDGGRAGDRLLDASPSAASLAPLRPPKPALVGPGGLARQRSGTVPRVGFASERVSYGRETSRGPAPFACGALGAAASSPACQGAASFSPEAASKDGAPPPMLSSRRPPRPARERAPPGDEAAPASAPPSLSEAVAGAAAAASLPATTAEEQNARLRSELLVGRALALAVPRTGPGGERPLRAVLRDLRDAGLVPRWLAWMLDSHPELFDRAWGRVFATDLARIGASGVGGGTGGAEGRGEEGGEGGEGGELSRASRGARAPRVDARASRAAAGALARPTDGEPATRPVLSFWRGSVGEGAPRSDAPPSPTDGGRGGGGRGGRDRRTRRRGGGVSKRRGLGRGRTSGSSTDGGSSRDASPGRARRLALSRSRYATDFSELRQLGKGGFGVVVAASNRFDGRTYAVKKILLDPGAPAAHARIMREATTLSRLQHPHVVRYFQAWTERAEVARGKRAGGKKGGLGAGIPPGPDSLGETWSDTAGTDTAEADEGRRGGAAPSAIVGTGPAGGGASRAAARVAGSPNATREWWQESTSGRGSEGWREHESGDESEDEDEGESEGESGSGSESTCSSSCSEVSKAYLLGAELDDSGLDEAEGSSFWDDAAAQRSRRKVAGSKAAGHGGGGKAGAGEGGGVASAGALSAGAPSASSPRAGSGDLSGSATTTAGSLDSSLSLTASAGVGGAPGESSRRRRRTQQILYIQMEYCPRTLADELQAGSMDDASRWRVLRQTLSGLVYIHAQGVIHRDLKPANIFYDARGEVRLGDFGLAKFAREDEEGGAQRKPAQSPRAGGAGGAVPGVAGGDGGGEGGRPAGATPEGASNSLAANPLAAEHTTGVGTSWYISPEIEQGWASYDERVDLYSLGVVTFELWHPFSTGMERAALLRDLKDKDVMPADFEAQHPEVARLIRWMMARSPADRPTAREALRSPLVPPAVGDDALTDLLRSLPDAPAAADRVLEALFAGGAEPGGAANAPPPSDAGPADADAPGQDGDGARERRAALSAAPPPLPPPALAPRGSAGPAAAAAAAAALSAAGPASGAALVAAGAPTPAPALLRGRVCDAIAEAWRRHGAVPTASPVLGAASAAPAACPRLLLRDGTRAALRAELRPPWAAWVARHAPSLGDGARRYEIATTFRTAGAASGAGSSPSPGALAAGGSGIPSAHVSADLDFVSAPPSRTLGAAAADASAAAGSAPPTAAPRGKRSKGGSSGVTDDRLSAASPEIVLPVAELAVACAEALALCPPLTAQVEVRIGHRALFDAGLHSLGLDRAAAARVPRLLATAAAASPLAPNARAARWPAIRAALEGLGAAPEVARRCKALLLSVPGEPADALFRLKAYFGPGGAPKGVAGALEALELLVGYLDDWDLAGLGAKLVLDPLVAPAAEYIGGPVFQIHLALPSTGASVLVGVGGRYDALLKACFNSEARQQQALLLGGSAGPGGAAASGGGGAAAPGAAGRHATAARRRLLLKAKLPPSWIGAGATLNVDRLAAVAAAAAAAAASAQGGPRGATGLAALARRSSADVFVASRGGGGMLRERMEVVRGLWGARVSAETLLTKSPSSAEQYDAASNRGASWLVLVTAATFAADGTAHVKGLSSRVELDIAPDELPRILAQLTGVAQLAAPTVDDEAAAGWAEDEDRNWTRRRRWKGSNLG